MKQDWLNQLQWDKNGLIPAIAQDAKTGDILMMAWMNRESLQLSVERNIAVYWSRSRQKLWQKGESSGHSQEIISIHCDCDQDVVLLKVKQNGGIACHTGRQSCFYHRLDNQQWQIDAPVLKSAEQIYSQGKK